MCDQHTTSHFLQPLTASHVARIASKAAVDLERNLQQILECCTEHSLSPTLMHELEQKLSVLARQTAQGVLQQTLELSAVEADKQPAEIIHEGRAFRRLLGEATPVTLASTLGPVTLTRCAYRLGSRGHCIFPAEMILGTVQNFTPLAADRLGQCYAATGSTQRSVIELFEQSSGQRIGVRRLRQFTEQLAQSIGPHHQEAAAQKLLQVAQHADSEGKKPTLVLSRDGVTLGLKYGHYEMAAVGSIAVWAGGKQLAGVHVATEPQPQQPELSGMLNALAQRLLSECEALRHTVVYVSDAGRAEEAYYQDTLRHLEVDGETVAVQRIVDYYHASSRLTVIADALQWDAATRGSWLRRMRKSLKGKGGVASVLRSVGQLTRRFAFKSGSKSAAMVAIGYFRKYRGAMHYESYRASGWPIGSGVIESACKQVVAQRLKLAGQRWKRPGAATTIRLRTIATSRLWSETFTLYLQVASTQIRRFLDNNAKNPQIWPARCA